MELEGKRCAIEPFSIAQAQVKIGFDARIITDVFQKELSKRLSKKRLSIQESHPGMGGQEITVRGQFIRIDGGDRCLRLSFPFLAGKAVIEVKGKLFLGDIHVRDLYAKAIQAIGGLGGSSQGLLDLCKDSSQKDIEANY